MQALWIPIIVAAGLLPGFAAYAADLDLEPAPSRLTIQVSQGDWGTANTSDIQTVLESVANVLGPQFPQQAVRRIQVAFSSEGPRVLFDQSVEGAHIVLLNARDIHWAQFTYQFSHELCHIFSNYERRIANDGTDTRAHRWFEESLCEMVSLFALRGVALRWEESPPRAHWKDYAPAFLGYREHLLIEQHRQLPPDKTFADWYNENQALLENDPYLREKDELIAGELLALIDDMPGAVGTIGYLNLDDSANEQSFAAYLASWRNRCPEGKREFIDRVISLFFAPYRDVQR